MGPNLYCTVILVLIPACRGLLPWLPRANAKMTPCPWADGFVMGLPAHWCPRPGASYQIRQIASCACAGNAENVFLVTNSRENASSRSRHAPRHVRDACPVMHIGITNTQWWGKRSRHFRRMRNMQFDGSGKKPIVTTKSCRTSRKAFSHSLLVSWILKYR